VEIQNLTPEDVRRLSYSEAIALARQIGLELPEDDPQIPPEAPG
jgi:hypothetical protein